MTCGNGAAAGPPIGACRLPSPDRPGDLTESSGAGDPSRVEDAQVRELMLEYASYEFAVGNLTTVFERSGTLDQFRSQLEQNAVEDELVRENLQVLDWVETCRSQQKTLLQIGLAKHELLLIRACVPMLLMQFVSSVTNAESDQLNEFIASLDSAAPGPYGEISRRVSEQLESAMSMVFAARDVYRENPDLRM